MRTTVSTPRRTDVRAATQGWTGVRAVTPGRTGVRAVTPGRTGVRAVTPGRTGVGAALATLTGIVATIAATLGIAACGSSTPSGTEADPASLAPASSLLYLSASVRPQGALRQRALADLRTLTHAKLPLEQLLQAIAGSSSLGNIDFKREVEPWVGARAGVFATSGNALANLAATIGTSLDATTGTGPGATTGTGPGATTGTSLGGGFSPQALLAAGSSALLGHPDTQAALVLDTRDLQRARTFVSKLASRQGASQAVYRGVAYNVGSHGAAEAIVGKFAVFGNQAGVKEAIDAHLGAPSLMSANGPYATLAAKGPTGALAGIYLNPVFKQPAHASQRNRPAAGEIGQGMEAAGAESQASSLLRALPGQPTQARVSIVPGHGSLQIDADLLTASGEAESKGLGAASAAAHLLEGLPEGSWLAAGAGEAGAHAVQYFSLASTLADVASKTALANLGGPALKGLLGKLSSHAGALQRVFAGWHGPAAAFAAGSGLLNLQAGLVIQASSPAAAREAVRKLGVLLSNAAGASVSSVTVPSAESALSVRVQGLPVVIDLGAGAGKLVIGLGPQSVQGALSPTGALSGSSTYAGASSALGGGKPAAILDVPMALALVEGLGLNESPALAPTLGHLRSLGLLAGGVQGLGGGVIRLRAIAKLQG